MSNEALLQLENISAGYGGVDVLHDVSITLSAREFVSVVGSNGAGKTTLFKTISGVVAATAGAITWKGKDLLRVDAPDRARLGLAHVPEGRQVFPSLSVLENLEMGAYAPANKNTFAGNLERIFTWFPLLKERSNQPAGTLSGGEQQMLAIGRGLAADPEILMLDEPSMGLAPAIADEIFERLIEIHHSGSMSIMLVEQRVAEALHFANRAYVLETGRIIMSGSPIELRNDDRIRQAYLGM